MHSIARSFLRNPVGIRFADLLFSEPLPLETCQLPHGHGLFAVLMPDDTWAPRQYQPLFFGEYGNLQDAPTAAVRRDHYLRWLRTAAGRQLYIAICSAPSGLCSELRKIK